MRALVFFDLPTETNEDKRNYRQFRKLLIKNGFIMLQESVYTRMLITPTAQRSVHNLIRRNRPPAGIVQVLTVKEKQYGKMEYVTGEIRSDIIDRDERLVVI